LICPGDLIKGLADGTGPNTGRTISPERSLYAEAEADLLVQQRAPRNGLVRASYVVLRVTGQVRESKRFINNRVAEGMGDREREICLPVDLAHLTAVTLDAVRDYPRAAYISRRHVDDAPGNGLAVRTPADRLPN
jgi:hypothetical protein